MPQGRDPRGSSQLDGARARRLRVTVVALLVSVAGFAFALNVFLAPPRTPDERATAVDNGLIAIAHGRDQDIVLVDQTTGDVTSLVDRNGEEPNTNNLAMAWSPDGSMLAFTDVRANGLNGLFVLDLATRDILDLSEDLNHADHPAWSPDGRRIVFGGIDSGPGYEIFVAASDGTNRIQVTDYPDDGVSGAHMPAWSPDGERIAFRFDRYDATTKSESHGIGIVGASGGNAITITDGPDELPAWSPDGATVAFVRRNDDGTSSLRTVTADGREEHVVSGTGVTVASTAAPKWSPDGTWILYSYQDPETSNLGAAVTNVSTGVERVAIEEAFIGEPVWAPDGTRVAFIRDDAGRPSPAASLWLIAPDGTDEIEVADGLEHVTDVAWQPLPITAGIPAPSADFSPTSSVTAPGSIDSKGAPLPEGRLVVNVGEGDAVELLEAGMETSITMGRDLFALDLSSDGRRALVTKPWGSAGPVTALWALEVTTTERSEIADLGSWGMPARWSPDGSHVAVRIRDRLLCIIGVVTRDLTCLPELGRVYEFDWSPDGTRLVYEGGLPGALTLLDPGTGQQSTLVRWDDPRVLAALADAGLASVTGVQFQGPLWSPSGRYVAALAMVGTDEGHAGNVVSIFDPSGNIVARGVPFGEFSDARGWSPSGDLFAYASGEPPYRIVDVHVLDVSAGEDRVVASTDNVGRGTIRSLAWSPSGRWLAVVSIVGSGGYYGSQIRVLDLTGGELPRIFESASILDLVGWGP